jgi:heterodisulfide reductase subunit A-like polyferredoxin
MACAPETSYPTFRKSVSSNVAIVGAGVVGLTAAYLLASAGVSVTVLEAHKVGRQVTGRSTAKVTSQHALIYTYLVEKDWKPHDSTRMRIRPQCAKFAVKLKPTDRVRLGAEGCVRLPPCRRRRSDRCVVARSLGLARRSPRRRFHSPHRVHCGFVRRNSIPQHLISLQPR